LDRLLAEPYVTTTRRKKMMNELVNKLTAETGLSQDQAQTVVNSVLGFLKERLPAPLAGELENLINPGESSGEVSGGLAAKATAALGNLFESKG
jgi:hypothetical protein